MQVKFFREYPNVLDMRINAWLSENRAIQIRKIGQSQSHSLFGDGPLTISVWYEERT